MNFNVTLVLFLAKFSLLLGALSNHLEPKRNVLGTPEGRIVGGHDALPHSHPYLVSLQMRFLWVRAHLCGGTLLSEYWILTAGHCVRESWIIRWLPMDAIAGAHNVDKLGPEAQVVTVSQRIHHPLYKGGIGPNDIAVLRTSSPFYFTKEVQPVHLPLHYKGNPESLVLTGWGVLRTTFFFPDMPEKLQEVNVTYIQYDECRKAVDNMKEDNEENPLDKDANICTGPLTGGVAGCNGDSGGPLIQYMTSEKYYDYDSIDENTTSNIDDNINEVTKGFRHTEYTDEERIPVVVGVVSWGVSPCGQKGAPTVYTKVSKYIDFINQYIKT